MTDSTTIEWTGIDGRRRRWTFIPDTSGREGWRIEERWTPTGWCEVGREPVSDVAVDGPEIEA